MKDQNTTRAAFIDLDATLLGPDHRVSLANLAALDRLRDAGIQPVIASGRHHRNILGLDQIEGIGWIISSQGSLVRHRQADETLLEMTLLPDRVTEICRRARQEGMTAIGYHRDGVFIEECSEWTDLYARKSGWTPRLVDFDELEPHGFYKVLWSGEPARIEALADTLKVELRGRYDLVITEGEILEFLAPGANKAVGAAALAERLALLPENALAFGDGHNDVELLEWAGVSVAMNHGRESARQAARFVSPPGPPESAFARAVELALKEFH